MWSTQCTLDSLLNGNTKKVTPFIISQDLHLQIFNTKITNNWQVLPKYHQVFQLFTHTFSSKIINTNL